MIFRSDTQYVRQIHFTSSTKCLSL